VKTDCVACGRRIKHRPYMPATAKKICIECFGEMSEHEENEAEQNSPSEGDRP
jgi:recombinational DNA repair protein (RecF pathway)